MDAKHVLFFCIFWVRCLVKTRSLVWFWASQVAESGGGWGWFSAPGWLGVGFDSFPTNKCCDFKEWFQMLEKIIISKAILELLILSRLFPVEFRTDSHYWFTWFCLISSDGNPGSIGAERIYKHKSLACPDASYPNQWLLQCCRPEYFFRFVIYSGNSGMKLVSRVVMLLLCDPPSNFNSCPRNIIFFQGRNLSTKWFLHVPTSLLQNA